MANIATAFANTLMGMGTVFVMLIFISLLISLLDIFQIRREDQKYREKTRTCKDRRTSRSCRGTTDTGS